VPEDVDLEKIKEIHLHATALLGTVHMIVVVRRACIRADPKIAGDLDIFTGSRANRPASCTFAIAILGRRLDEAGCKNQAEGYRE